jgi:uncharacterized protein YceH (UPF0502 family)
MIELTPDECRVLGVLIEKAQTTPDQYPLSLNAVVNGANQKNNRDPLLTMDEDRAFDAVEGLRGKGLVIQTDQAGSRVHKYRHSVLEKLHVRSAELALLAELLLRGPQTLGELRGRASRMHAFETTDAVKEMLRALMERAEPLAKEVAPSPGSRAERYAQLLCPALHPLDAAPVPREATAAPAPSATIPAASLGERVQRLESQVAALTDALRQLAAKLGEPDPLPNGQAAPVEVSAAAPR